MIDMKNSLKIKCPAKVNLSLDVVRRRKDGYHELEMVMHTVNLFDTVDISIEDANEILVMVSTDSAIIPSDDSNLCAKAANLFLNEIGVFKKVNIYIEKNIPVGAGLGGGSSDAAGTLLALNQLLDNPLSAEALAGLAKKIGADVPFFIYGGCMLARGIGEILSPLPSLREATILIAKPDYGISTPYVYKNLKLDINIKHPDTQSVIKAIQQNDLSLLGKASENVLETVVCKEYPEIEEYKQIMKNHGAVYSLMSGSGSSVFGVFANIQLAENAAKELKTLTNHVYIA